MTKEDVYATSDPEISKPLSSYEARQIDWLWDGRIPLGCITLLEGDGGIGKSFVIAALGAALSRGHSLPEDMPRSPTGVLLLAAEDDPNVVLRPRFESHDANLDLVRCFDQSMLLNKEGLERLESEIRRHRVKLVVIDPIVSFLGASLDASKATDVRSVMQPLHDMARLHSCAIVVVRHWNKNLNAKANHRGSGSVDFRNAARSVLQVIKTPDCTYLTLEKSNYGADGKTLTFRIENGNLEWTGTSNLKADEILAQNVASSPDAKSDLEEAEEFLRDELANGPVLSKDLATWARDRDISPATLKRAKRKLGVFGFKLSGANQYYCKLGDGAQKGDEAHVPLRDELDPHPPLEPHPLHPKPTMYPGLKAVLDKRGIHGN